MDDDGQDAQAYLTVGDSGRFLQDRRDRTVRALPTLRLVWLCATGLLRWRFTSGRGAKPVHRWLWLLAAFNTASTAVSGLPSHLTSRACVPRLGRSAMCST